MQFSYIVNETKNEEFVSVPEQGGGKIIPIYSKVEGVMKCSTSQKAGQLN